MKKKMILMCGVPGSGKSTWIRNHEDYFGNSYRVISRDFIRFSMLKDGEDYFAHEKDVFKEFARQVNESLHKNDLTIVDATHISVASRKKIINALDFKGLDVELIAVVMRTSLEVALSRNELRKADSRTYVPETAIRNMYKSFQFPSFDEGFDKIIKTPINQRKGDKYIISILTERLEI